MEPAGLLRELGRRCRERRGARGLTLRELSARCGLSQRFLVQIEAGRGNVSVLKLAELARALGTTPAALLSGEERKAPVVALLGLRGAGKSTIGRRLARRLHVPFVELDRRIEQAADLSLREIFSLHGEDYYRRLEREALERVLSEGRPLVLATGGGIVNSPEAHALLERRALTVWLKAAPEQHWNRVVQQGDRRPMADHPQAMAELRRLLLARQPLYAAADHTVDTSRLGIEGTVAAVERVIAGRGPARPRSRSTRPTGS